MAARRYFGHICVRFFQLFHRSICPALSVQVGCTSVGYLLLIEMMNLDGAFALVSTQRLVLFKFARARNKLRMANGKYET